MKIIKHILFLTLISVSLLSCSDQQERNDFIDVYGDVLMARVENKNDIEAQFAVDSVLEAHGYDFVTFGEELEKFSTNDPDFSLVIDSLRTAITERAAILDSIENNAIIDSSNKSDDTKAINNLDTTNN